MSHQEEQLQKEYRLRFSKIEAYRTPFWKILCSHYFKKFIPKTATVFDLGSGWGEFINNIDATKKMAIDLNPETKNRLSEDVLFFHQDCSSKWPLEEGVLDIVFTSNCLEHIQNKETLETVCDEVHRCLKKGGLFICLGPNIKYLGGHYWDFWDHRIALTERSLSELLQLKDFAIDLCLPRFLPFSMSIGRNPPLFLVKLYLKLPLFWPIFGKQFFVIGRKL